MEEFVYNNERKIQSVNCVDHNTGIKVNITARNFVSAAGPWVDLLRTKDASMNNKRLHLTKGVHIVFRAEKLPIKQSVYFDVDDGRMIFAIPRGRVTYVGTTDTNYSGNLDRVVATKDDVNYLLNAVNKTFPTVKVTINDVESNWAGLRPLIHEDKKDPSELSRKDETFISDTGLISIAGGKLTGYRKMAHRVIEVVLKSMSSKRRSKFKKTDTEKIALTSQPMQTITQVNRYQKELENRLKNWGIIDPYYAWYLTTTYGKQADIILNKTDFFANDAIEEKLIRAELWYCVYHEMTNSLADFFVRRTGRLYFNIASVSKFKEIIIGDIVEYLDWDDSRLTEEIETLSVLLEDATHYYDEELA